MSRRIGPWYGDDRTPAGDPSEAVTPRTIRGAWTSPAEADERYPLEIGAPRPTDPATVAALARLQTDARTRAHVSAPVRPTRKAPPPPLRPRVPVADRSRRATHISREIEAAAPPALHPDDAETSTSDLITTTFRPVPSVSPVERQVPPSARGFRSSRFGWGAAAALLGVSVAFYVFAYTPLRLERDNLLRASAAQTEHSAQAAQHKAISSKPTPERSQPPAAPAAPAGKPGGMQPSAAENRADEHPKSAPQSRVRRELPTAAEETKTSERQPRAKQETKPSVAHETEREAYVDQRPALKSKTKIDLAAAAAATAALEAEAYGTEPAPSQKPSAEELPTAAQPKAAKRAEEPPVEKPDGLSGVVNESSDPLDGL